MRHLLSQHKDACKTKDCRSCSITMDFAAEWDIKHRGKALKERFGYTKGVWLLHSINFPVTPQKRNSAEGANFPFFFSFFHFVLICLFFFYFSLFILIVSHNYIKRKRCGICPSVNPCGNHQSKMLLLVNNNTWLILCIRTCFYRIGSWQWPRGTWWSRRKRAEESSSGSNSQ